MNQSEKEALAKQAEACLVSGQLEKAKSLYSRLVEIDSNDEEAWLMLAAVLGETGSIDDWPAVASAGSDGFEAAGLGHVMFQRSRADIEPQPMQRQTFSLDGFADEGEIPEVFQ